jgi:hypothetical protein
MSLFITKKATDNKEQQRQVPARVEEFGCPIIMPFLVVICWSRQNTKLDNGLKEMLVELREVLMSDLRK